MSYSEQTQVTYGTLGTARYNHEQRRWNFSRDTSAGITLRVLEAGTVWPKALDGVRLPDAEQSDYLRPARTRSRRLDALLRLHPELTPGSSMLEGMEQISSAVLQLEHENEPLASRYIAYGKVEFEDPNGVPFIFRSRRVLATVTGTSKHIVRLTLASDQIRYARQNNNDFEFVASRFDRNYATFWTSNHKTKIMDVQFSTDDDNGSLLAVRRHMSVDILQPIVRRIMSRSQKISRAEIGTGEVSANSYLDPNWILRISLADFDSVPLADFTFHPRNPFECAILSISGEAKLVGIQPPRHKRDEWTTIIRSEVTADEMEPKGKMNDGWARILWLDANGPILIATRYDVCSRTFDGGEFPTSPVVLDAASQKSYILDMKHDVHNKKHIFVLTSSDLVVLSRPTSPKASLPEAASRGIDVSFSLPHYRDPDDVSLQISIAVHNHTAYILIFSRISTLITGFKLSFEGGSGELERIYDPFVLDLHSKSLQELQAPPQEISKQMISSLNMEAIEAEQANHDCSPIDSVPETGQLFEIIVLDHFHCVNRLIAVADSCVPIPADITLLPALEETIDQMNPHKQQGKRHSFISISDEDCSEDDSKVSIPDLQQTRSSISDGLDILLNNFAFLGQEINERILEFSGMTQSMGSFESALEDILKSRHEIQIGVHTLTDFLSSAMPVDRIDVVASKTSELLDAIRKLEESPADSLKMLGVPQKLKPLTLLSQDMIACLQDQKRDHGVQLVPIYEKLLQIYVHSLPQEISPIMRVRFENLVRRASMHLFLAGHGIQTVDQKEHTSSRGEDKISTVSVEPPSMLPIRPPDGRQGTGPQIAQPQAAKVVPLASPSSSFATVQPLSSQFSTDIASTATSTDHILAQYLTFRPDNPIPASIRKRVPEWQVGEYPTGFEWKGLLKTASQESVRSFQNDSNRRKRKEKGRAANSASYDFTDYNLDSFGTTTRRLQEGMLDDAMDDDLLASQHLPSQFKDSSQSLQPDELSSQTLAINPTAMRGTGLASQTQLLRPRERTAVKKRPSGFR